jgi:hypothetical protein
MRPSGRFNLDPNAVYRNPRAAQRAKWLVEDVSADVDATPELSHVSRASGARPDVSAGGASAWELVATVAEGHPRLLAWLAEGQVTWYWNVFGALVAVLRLIPGLRRMLWHFLFEPVARTAPWRMEVLEAILQERRWKLNNGPDSNARLSTTTLTIIEAPGLNAVTDVATVTQNAACDDVREKIEKMSSGCLGVSGLRGSGKSTLIRDFCRHRYGTPAWSASGSARLPGLRLMIQVPLPYDAREFLIHLYTCLCKAVLADTRLNATSSGRHAVLAFLVPRSIRPAALLRGLSGIALLVLAGAWPAGRSPADGRYHPGRSKHGRRSEQPPRSSPRWRLSAGGPARR